MSVKLFLAGAAAVLVATPTFAAVKHPVRHHAARASAMPAHNGPIPYSELAAVDARMNGKGYNARTTRHRRMSAPGTSAGAATSAAPAGAPASTAGTSSSIGPADTTAGAGASAATPASPAAPAAPASSAAPATPQ
jgi:hypothetical protein